MRADLLPWRLDAQWFDSAPSGTTGAGAIGRLGAVQAQLFEQSLWAISRRVPGATLESLTADFQAGRWLRTHVLRPTWHHLLSADLHWMLAVTGPRCEAAALAVNRGHGVDEATSRRAAGLIAQAVRAADRPLLRADLARATADLTIPGTVLGNAIGIAESRVDIVSGPMADGHPSWVGAGPAPDLPDRSALLAELARRYSLGHGPITAEDLRWWANLTLTDARRAIADAGLQPWSPPGSGEAFWVAETPTEREVPAVLLLANYDELVSYRRSDADYAACAVGRDIVGRSAGLVLVRGVLVGVWNRATRRHRVEVSLQVRDSALRGMRRALRSELDRYAAFCGQPTVLV